MISNAITKLLEFVLYDKIVTASSEDMYQFGAKAKHSTGLCAGILKHAINYYADLHCRHICFHGIFGIFYCVSLIPTLDVTLVAAW